MNRGWPLLRDALEHGRGLIVLLVLRELLRACDVGGAELWRVRGFRAGLEDPRVRTLVRGRQ